MRIRSKILLTLGVACLSASALAGGALAHGSEGKSDLKLEIRGTVTAVDAASITIDPGTPLATWTCAVPAELQPELTGIVTTDQVKAKCRDKNGVLTLTRIREKGGQHNGEHKTMDHGGQGGRVEVEARGIVTSVGTPDPTTGNLDIAVQPGPAGSTLPLVTCTVTKRTHVFGTPTVGENVKIKCKSRNGLLVAKRIKEKGLMKPGQVQVEVKGPSATFANGSITIGSVSCTATDAQITGIDLTKPVEAHCAGNPLALLSIHQEG